MSYDDDELIAELRKALLDVWKARVPQAKIAEIAEFAGDLAGYSGVTVVGPTRDRSVAVTAALCEFLELAFNTTDLGAPAALAWCIHPVSGGDSDKETLEASLDDERQIWLTVPASPCSVARFWGVCNAHKSDRLGLSKLHMNALIPGHLVGTYLSTEFFGYSIRTEYDGFVVSYPKPEPTAFDVQAGSSDPSVSQPALVHLTPDAFNAFRERYADIGNLAISAIHDVVSKARKKAKLSMPSHGGPGLARR